MAEQKGLIRKAQAYNPESDTMWRDSLQARLNILKKDPKKNFAEIGHLTPKIATINNKMTMAKAGKNPDGSPYRPEYESLINKDTGLLNSEYTLADKWKAVQLDGEGYDKFKTEALRDPSQQSAYANMMLQNTELNKQKNIDDMAGQQNAAQQGAMDNLAAQGGIDGGSRERMAMGGIRDSVMGRQMIRRDAQQEGLGIKTQDEQQRVSMLSQMPGMELARGNFEMTNEANRMNALTGDRDSALGAMNKEKDMDMDAWKTGMESWAANKSADAQKAASGGCFPAGTMVTMFDGTLKAIEDISTNDELLVGGQVLASMIIPGVVGLYDYLGVFVTGDHAVYEDAQWKRVKDSNKAIFTNEYVDVVYNLITEFHKIGISNIMFADFEETDAKDLDNETSLKAMNENVYVC